MEKLLNWLWPSRPILLAPFDALKRDIARKMECPCCHTEDAFLSGPEGGMNVNVMCEACGTRLNLAFWGGELWIIEWTHGPQPEIWGGREQTAFPDPAHVENVKALIEQKGMN